MKKLLAILLLTILTTPVFCGTPFNIGAGRTATIKFTGVSLNTINTDLAISSVSFPKWVVEKAYAVSVAGNSVPLAAITFYSQAAAAGDNVVTATVLSTFTGAGGLAQSLTLPTLTKVTTDQQIVLRSTAAGLSAATADVYVILRELP